MAIERKVRTMLLILINLSATIVLLGIVLFATGHGTDVHLHTQRNWDLWIVAISILINFLIVFVSKRRAGSA